MVKKETTEKNSLSVNLEQSVGWKLQYVEYFRWILKPALDQMCDTVRT